MRKRGWAVTGLGTLVLLLAACGSSSTSPGSAYGTSSANPMPSGSSSSSPTYGSGTSGSTAGNAATLTIKKTKIGNVLANAKGYTLYWYAKDRKGGQSTCTGPCLTAWPALKGKPEAAMGATLVGKLGSITRPGGIVQATYNGYPLYTYAQDMSPGETTGNGAGGVWHVITGSVLSSSRTSGSGSSGSGYGSGY
jgi:predicted lipoprotein with Yx(FWY)xxD motif